MSPAPALKLHLLALSEAAEAQAKELETRAETALLVDGDVSQYLILCREHRRKLLDAEILKDGWRIL